MIEDLLRRLGWTADDVRRFAYAVCTGLSHVDREDIAQEVSLKVVTRFQSPSPPAIETEPELKRYIFTITRNKKFSLLEEKKKQDRRVARFAAGGPARSTYEETRFEILGRLSEGQRAAILNLLPEDKPRYRDAMRLRLEGLTFAEIGKHLNVSEATAYRYIANSLEYVGPRISEIVDHPSVAVVPEAGQ